MTSLHRFSGPDGFSDHETLPPVIEGPMTPQEAMQRLHWLMAREREACRAQPNQNALALMLAMMVLQNQIDRAPKPGEHEHRCGVLGCDNRFSCTRERCAGTTWICPACELDQRDTYHSNT
jgi:hypothetical protein